jgi:DNA-directed RNA polymerase specialized sigma24 family protein
LTPDQPGLEDKYMTQEDTLMADRDCRAGRLKAQDAAHHAAMELYQLAALMLGDEAQAVELVETAVAQSSIDPCADAAASVDAARLNLVETAVARLSQSDPAAFDAPALLGNAAGCIEEDDLSSAGISAGELSRMLSGPGRHILRDWLNKLPLAQRTIFVERAILGWDNAAAAASLSRAAARAWQPRQVSELFRQALCSLATSLVHAAAQV